MALRVLALESYWSESPADSRSVRPILQLVQDNRPKVDVHYRHFGTRKDVQWYLDNWWRSGRYDVLYLAAHGEKGSLTDDWGGQMTFDWLRKHLSGACRDRVLYLSACESMAGSPKAREKLLDESAAAALVGYEEQVEWVAGAAMDLLALSELASKRGRSWNSPPGRVLANLKRKQAHLAGVTGFEVVAA